VIYAHRILGELDRQLTSEIELTLYGRAAFFLGFPNPLIEFSQSLDVDVVLWLGQAEALDANSNFWDALAKTNSVLKNEGFYMSHLFEEDQVILTKEWRKQRIEVKGDWENLNLSRLSDVDLFLSKLMRDDPQDRQDALFIVDRNKWSMEAIHQIFERAVVPNLQELRDEFTKAGKALLKVLS